MSKTTTYKNISWRQRERKWEAGITVKGVKYNAGSYFDEIEAVKALDTLIIKKGFDYRKLQIIKPVKSEK